MKRKARARSRAEELKMKPILMIAMAILVIFWLGNAGAQVKKQPLIRDTRSDTWAAPDSYGGSLPTIKEAGSVRKGKFVGIFYFLWQDKRHDSGFWDISKLLAENPDNPKFGPENAFHWWGEPRLGYYLSRDPFIIRKEAQMLSDVGVDVIILDVTNALTYDEDTLAICKIYEEIRKSGGKTPQIAFIAHSAAAKTVQHLYDNFYSKNLYPDLWFQWKGKPLLLTDESKHSPEVEKFFSIRESWAWSDPNGWFKNGKDKWTWIDNHPQKAGWHESPDKPEAISVCTAQHATSNIGRSFHNGKQPTQGNTSTDWGFCFREQWDRALKVDPEFVFITGWNEWIAQRFINPGQIGFLDKLPKKGDTFFVDQYNQEYSRDIEPMRGGHGDKYYRLMASYIRKFKGVREPQKPSPMTSINLAGGFKQWERVGPEYLDDIGDTAHRDFDGWTGHHYTDNSGRNDLEKMKVARDDKQLYFYVRTATPITPWEETTWMNLYLIRNGDLTGVSEGYDYRISSEKKSDGKLVAILQKFYKGPMWKPIAELKMSVKGREMQLAIPRALIELEPNRGKLKLQFKWADNVPSSFDPLNFLEYGDAAPNGSFNYRFEE